MTEQLLPLGDGWFQWAEAPDDVEVTVLLEEADDGRHHITTVQISGRVAADVLRGIPIGRIEAAANAAIHTGRTQRTGQARIPERYRDATGAHGYPDGLYDAVASAYRMLAASSPRPVAELAAANDIPLSTAQRWVREARRRGKLPPGRPGKAG